MLHKICSRTFGIHARHSCVFIHFHTRHSLSSKNLKSNPKLNVNTQNVKTSRVTGSSTQVKETVRSVGALTTSCMCPQNTARAHFDQVQISILNNTCIVFVTVVSHANSTLVNHEKSMQQFLVSTVFFPNSPKTIFSDKTVLFGNISKSINFNVLQNIIPFPGNNVVCAYEQYFDILIFHRASTVDILYIFTPVVVLVEQPSPAATTICMQ